jgi:glucose-1-phosphate cytidylyltransferase
MSQIAGICHKAIILAGGMGTRISEESHLRPKPMIEIGGMPILWHIMKIYSHHGITDFVICLGYKGNLIKEYFANYFLYTSDVTFDLSRNQLEVHHRKSEPWRVTLVDTGEKTMTGGRLARVRPYIGDSTFCFTYGDGVADINITELLQSHKTSGKLATVTAVQPPGRYGALEFHPDSETAVTRFQEKPTGDGAWINGGFFVLEPEALNYIKDGDATVWERSPLESLAEANELNAFKHKGFWQPMDTLRDKTVLDELWNTGRAPWKTW